MNDYNAVIVETGTIGWGFKWFRDLDPLPEIELNSLMFYLNDKVLRSSVHSHDSLEDVKELLRYAMSRLLRQRGYSTKILEDTY